MVDLSMLWYGITVTVILVLLSYFHYKNKRKQ